MAQIIIKMSTSGNESSQGKNVKYVRSWDGYEAISREGRIRKR